MELNQLIALITVLAQVVFLEGVLSLDNAAVLGAIVLRLPPDQPVPWPRRLSRLGQRLHGVLGMQRTAGLRVGLLGAYLGRGLMLVLASFVIRNPWLQLVGALYLLKMSVGELASHGEADGVLGESSGRLLRERSFWRTVLTVELMDLAFSLDNVVVVVTLPNELWLVMVGVALGILTMRFAAGIFSGLIEKIPALGPAAYLLVFNIGVEFILARLGVELGEGLRFGVNIGVLGAAVIYSRVPFLQRLMRWPFRMFGWLFTALDRFFSLVLTPFGYLWKKVTYFFRSTSRRRTELPQSGND
jgi:tellurite resistance protein TerC